jgi:hypothetical protein
MMDMSTILIAAMALMMIGMCGGMVAGVGTLMRRRRRDPGEK